MTQRELVEIVLKLAGVFFLARAIAQFPVVIIAAGLVRDSGPMVADLATATNATDFARVLAGVAVGVTLIAYANRIAQRLVPEGRALPIAMLTAHQLLWVGVALVGVILALYEVGYLAAALAEAIWFLGAARRPDWDGALMFFGAFQSVVVIAAGVKLASWAERRLRSEEGSDDPAFGSPGEPDPPATPTDPR